MVKILKEISPEYSLGRTNADAETPILRPPDAKNWLIGKDPDAGKEWRQEEKGTIEDEMVIWHHHLNGYVFEQPPGVGDGQGSLHAAVHGVAKSRTWLSNWTELNWYLSSWKFCLVSFLWHPSMWGFSSPWYFFWLGLVCSQAFSMCLNSPV